MEHNLSFTDFLINKQLEKHGVSIEELRQKYLDLWIGNLYWYEYYTATSEEVDEFRKWFYSYMSNDNTILTNDMIEKIFNNFYLNHGLKVKKTTNKQY